MKFIKTKNPHVFPSSLPFLFLNWKLIAHVKVESRLFFVQFLQNWDCIYNKCHIGIAWAERVGSWLELMLLHYDFPLKPYRKRTRSAIITLMATLFAVSVKMQVKYQS